MTQKGDEICNGITRKRKRSKLPESLSLRVGFIDLMNIFVPLRGHG
jgi:hypothetical protein